MTIGHSDASSTVGGTGLTDGDIVLKTKVYVEMVPVRSAREQISRRRNEMGSTRGVQRDCHRGSVRASL